MTIELGSTQINKIMLGSTEIKKVYLGSTLVYDKTGGTFTPTSFSIVQSFGEPNKYNSGASASPSSGLTEGNRLVVVTADRNGYGVDTHDVSDSNGGSWTYHGGLDSNLDDSGDRFAMAAWSREVLASDDGDTPTISVTGDTDDNGGMAFLAVEVEAGAGFGWNFEEIDLTTSGSDAWDTAPSPSITASNDDVLLLAAGGTKIPGSAPNESDFSFTDQPDDKQWLSESSGYHITFIAAIEDEGQAADTYTADLQDAGSWSELGIVLLMAWSG